MSRRAVIRWTSLAVVVMAFASPVGACPMCSYSLAGQESKFLLSGTSSLVLSATEEVGYSLPAGTLRLYDQGVPGGWVRANDWFTLSGLAPGTIVPLVVQFEVDGRIATAGCSGPDCRGFITAQIMRGTDKATAHAEETILSGPPRSVPLVVQLPLDFTVGQEEPITFALSVSGSPDHQVGTDGMFRFVGLPAGATITSCHGYVEVPTPALSASWGRVKAAYR